MPSSTECTPSLTSKTLAKLFPAPFLYAHLTSNPSIRPNGRSPATFRDSSINTSTLTHCSGSAVVRTGDVAVVCGIRAEILPLSNIPDSSFLHKIGSSPDSQEYLLEDLNLLIPNIELSTGCSPSNLPGAAPSSAAQSLSYRIFRLLLSTRLINLEDLRIMYLPAISRSGDDNENDTAAVPQTKAFWTLHISLLVLSLAGASFPTLWSALLAALRDLHLPRAWWDVDADMVLCSDRIEDARRLNLRGLPLAMCWGVFQTPVGLVERVRGHDEQFWILADPDEFEEEICEGRITIVVDGSAGRTKVVGIEKIGGSGVDGQEMGHLLKTAGERWKVVASIFRE